MYECNVKIICIVDNLGKILKPKLLDKTKNTMIITTFGNNEVGHLQTFKFDQNKKINHALKSQTLHIFQMVNN